MIKLTDTQAVDILEALHLARDFLDGQIDVKDGPDGPQPNGAMSVCALLDKAMRHFGEEA